VPERGVTFDPGEDSCADRRMAFPPTQALTRTFRVCRLKGAKWVVALGSGALGAQRFVIHGPATKARCVKWAQRMIKRNNGGTLHIED
jgi:hypothetical protein